MANDQETGIFRTDSGGDIKFAYTLLHVCCREKRWEKCGDVGRFSKRWEAAKRSDNCSLHSQSIKLNLIFSRYGIVIYLQTQVSTYSLYTNKLKIWFLSLPASPSFPLREYPHVTTCGYSLNEKSEALSLPKFQIFNSFMYTLANYGCNLLIFTLRSSSSIVETMHSSEKSKSSNP